MKQPPKPSPVSGGDPADPQAPLPAWRSASSHLFLWIPMMAGLAADLYTKNWALRTIGNPEHDMMCKPISLIDGYLQFITVFNRGAVAGVAQGKTAFLLIMSAAALVFLGWMFVHSHKGQSGTHIALGMLTGGAMGNIYDRLFNQGKVVDFIHVDLHVWPANPWPTFNVADMLLCAGVGLLMLCMIRQHRRQHKPA